MSPTIVHSPEGGPIPHTISVRAYDRILELVMAVGSLSGVVHLSTHQQWTLHAEIATLLEPSFPDIQEIEVELCVLVGFELQAKLRQCVNEDGVPSPCPCWFALVRGGVGAQG